MPGGHGQLGRELAARRASVVRAPGSAELDVTNAGAVVEAVKTLAESAAVADLSPVVVNAAAYNAVDDAETDATRAFAVNGDGPRLLAAACSSHGVPLVHVSTDYVFPGDGDRPYETDRRRAPAVRLRGDEGRPARRRCSGPARGPGWCGPRGCTARTATTS